MTVDKSMIKYLKMKPLLFIFTLQKYSAEKKGRKKLELTALKIQSINLAYEPPNTPFESASIFHKS